MPYSFHIQQAIGKLRQGGVIAYPTEAVWGLGCDPFNEVATDRLLALKNRDVSKGLILVASTLEQLNPFFTKLKASQINQLQQEQPVPTTWLIPDNGHVPPWIRGVHNTVAIRICAHPTVQQLCNAFGGPIVSTSANLEGREPAKNTLQLKRHFAADIDYTVPGELGAYQSPSQIKDLISGKIFRAG